MLKNSTLLLLIAGLLTFFSCSSYRKIPYFQDVNRERRAIEDINNYSPLTIQPSDILSVTVSSLNPLAYNDSAGRELGYLVNQDGEVSLPLIGKVKVAGLTTSVVEDQIQEKLTAYLTQPAVNVRVLNFKVAILGDVSRPDVYQVASERITITEALSMAGDLNITARRNDLLLIREVNGKREYVPLDLTSSDIFHSPYYYLKNNDVIYVQPDKTKYATVDGSYRTFSLVLSGLSIVAIILTNIL